MRHALAPRPTRWIDSMNRDTSARRLSVLVVDDDREAADSVALFLRMHGYDARAAYDAQQAMALFRHWHADAAVLDIVMEGIDGLELARRLRLMTTRPLFLVALTGLGTPDEYAPLSVSEFNHFLLKPVNTVELLRLLDACARRRAPGLA
jgi:DNA-binding response OmpR family regulator